MLSNGIFTQKSAQQYKYQSKRLKNDLRAVFEPLTPINTYAYLLERKTMVLCDKKLFPNIPI